MRGRAWVGCIVGMLVWAGGIEVKTLLGQTFRQTLGADEIVKRVMEHDAERRAALVHYGSERTYEMHYKGPIGERQARMRVRMDFYSPDRKRFTVISESGSTIFCHQILGRLMEGEQEGALEANRLRSMLSPANYLLNLVGEETYAGEKTWVLDVSPRDENRFNYKGRVWVNESDYAVARIVGTPAKNPTWLMGNSQFDYSYGRSGEFWLPAHNLTVSHLRIGGDIRLTVDYGEYEVVAVGGPAGVIAAANRGVGAREISGSLAISVPQ